MITGGLRPVFESTVDLAFDRDALLHQGAALEEQAGTSADACGGVGGPGPRFPAEGSDGADTDFVGTFAGRKATEGDPCEEAGRGGKLTDAQPVPSLMFAPRGN